MRSLGFALPGVAATSDAAAPERHRCLTADLRPNRPIGWSRIEGVDCYCERRRWRRATFGGRYGAAASKACQVSSLCEYVSGKPCFNTVPPGYLGEWT